MCIRDRQGRALVPIDEVRLAKAFVVGVERVVSADHVVSVDGVSYEMPLGFARQKVVIERHLLDDGSLHHPDRHGRLVRLRPVDVHANATAGRAERLDDSEPDEPSSVPTASMLRYEQRLGPITAPDGGFPHPDSDPSSEPMNKD